MLRHLLEQKVTEAVQSLVADGQLYNAEYPKVEITDTKSSEHGDFACNFALVASKVAQKNPRDLAGLLATALSADPDLSRVEVAGPGFVNLTVSPRLTGLAVTFVLSDPVNFYRSVVDLPLRINVEFVSVNPNGPITVGSGRGAAYGSCLCNVLEAAGHKVHREYYINDGVNSEQMRLFAESVKAILEGRPVPENGYKGDYVHEVAAEIQLKYVGYDQYDLSSLANLQQFAQLEMIVKQVHDLHVFGTSFDKWFSEQSLHDSGAVAKCVEELVAKGVADESEWRMKVEFAKGGEIKEVSRELQSVEEDEDSRIPSLTLPQAGENARTLWLRSTKFGDDMDRVMRRKDGRLTYIASDVSYHKDKFSRGSKDGEPADKLITVLGPDHHGYIGRLHAVVAALLERPASKAAGSFDENDAEIWKDAKEKQSCIDALEEAKQKLEVLIFQLVRFVKDGKPAPMRKRDGNIYALIDLINEIGEHVRPEGTKEEKQTVGRDVARFFYLMRSHDTTFDFDLNLAEKQSDENPVFYAQYAHARICSVIEKAGGAESGVERRASSVEEMEILSHPKERALILKLQDLGYEVERAAEDYGVNRLTTYATELARAYHHFYDACRVIQPDQPELSQARLALCVATKASLKATFDLLGISAPERM